MKKINDYKEYDELVCKVMPKGKKIVSNALFTAQAVRNMISDAELFYMEQNKGVLFLQAKERNFFLYFFLPDIQRFELPDLNKPILASQIYTEGRENKDMSSMILQSGFEEYGRYAYMSVHSKDMIIDSPLLDKVEFARHGMEEALINLWEKSMQIYTADIPAKKQLKKMIDDKQVLVIMDGETIAAAHVAIIHDNRIYTLLLATDRRYRRRGYARALEQFPDARMRPSDSCIHDFWVNVDNHIAIDGYLKYGFVFNKRRSVYFIKY